MIHFEQTSSTVELDCDQPPKTKFTLRSLGFADDMWVHTELAQLGVFPAAAMRRIAKVLSEGGELDDEQASQLQRINMLMETRDRLICARGVVAVDGQEVSPDEVLEKLGSIPSELRTRVASELSAKIQALGAPDPKR